MSDGTVIIEAGLDPKKFLTEVNNLASKTKSSAANIAKAFDSVGSSLTSKITKPAGIAAGAVAGIVLAKGWARMTEIDNAKAKLRAVGNTAKDVSSIMDNATEAVKGTAYGLDEAATASASAVAAGIKPGKELTQYLTNTADAAAVAGTSMGEMGNILNKVTTAGKAYTGDLNQLADRGLPIYQWLGEAAGKSAEEMQKGARKGQISAQMVQDAIQNNIAGAAKEIGSTTITGAISNVGASIGRIGANFLGSADDAKSFSGMLLPMLNNLMDKLGGAEDKAKKWGATFANVIKGVVGYYKKGDSAISKTSGTARKVLNAIKPVMAVTKTLGKAFGSLGTETKVKLVAGLLLAGPALKIASKAMLTLQKTSAILKTGYTGLRVATAAHTGATVANTSAIKSNGIAQTYANAVQAKMATATAKNSAEMARASTVTSIYGKNVAASSLYGVKATGVTAAYSVATKASAAASGVAAVAAKGLGTALAMVGGVPGLVMMGITLLAGSLLTFSDSSNKATSAADKEAAAIDRLNKKATESLKTYRDNRAAREKNFATSTAEAEVADRLNGRLQSLMGTEKKSTEQKRQIKAIVEKLNEIMPNLNLQYDAENDKLNKSNGTIQKSIEKTKELAKAKAAMSLMEESYKDKLQGEADRPELLKKQEDAQDKLNASVEKYGDLKNVERGDRVNWTHEQRQESYLQEELQDKYDKATDAVKKNSDQIAESENEISKYEGVLGYSGKQGEAVKQLEKSAQDAGVKAQEIPKSITEGIKQGIYAAPTTGDEYKQLVQLDSLVADAKAKGIEIPKSITNGMTQGGPALKTATADLQRLMVFSNSDVAAQAKAEGIKIPRSLTAGIASGKYQIPKSIKELNGLVKFDSLAKKAGKGGQATVKTLAAKMKAGKISVKEAVAILEKTAGGGLNKEAKGAGSGGSKTGKKYGKSIGDQKGAAAKGAKDVKSGADNEFNKASKGNGKGGKKDGEGYSKGVASAKGSASKAGKSLKDAASKGASGSVSSFHDAGYQMGMGVASGLRSAQPSVAAAASAIVAEANRAAKAAADIHSPSRLFRDTVGKQIGRGIAVGIKSEARSVVKVTRDLIKDTKDAAKNVKGNYAAIGQNFADKFSARIRSQQDKSIAVLKNANERRLNSIKKADEKEERLLEKKIEKAKGKNKKAYRNQLKALKAKHKAEQSNIKKAMSKAEAAYTKALTKTNDKLIKRADKNVAKLSKKYQDSYDKLIDKRNAMQEKLLHTGELLTQVSGSISGLRDFNSGNVARTLDKNIKDLEKYEANLMGMKGRIPSDLMDYILGLSVPDANRYMKKLLKMEDAKFDEYIAKWKAEQQTVKDIQDKYLTSNTLGNLNDDIAVMKQYQDSLKNLKKRVPDSLWEEILGMDITQANAYMDELRGLSDAEFKKYIDTWNQKVALSKKISSDFFAPDLSALKKSYKTAINKEMSALSAQLKKAGNNAGKALTAGLKSGSKGMSKAIRAICNQAIKEAKKTLKIKSPSRVFMEIGRNTIKGAEVGEVKQAEKLYQATDKVVNNWAERFSGADIDPTALVAGMQRTVQAEMSILPASVVKVMHKLEVPETPEAQPRMINITIENPIGEDKLIRLVDKGFGKVEVLKERG